MTTPSPMVLALTNPRHPETAKEIVIGRIHFMGWPAFVQGVASRVPRLPHAKNGNLGRAGNAQADGPQSEGGPGLRSDLSRRSPQGEGGRPASFPPLPPVKTNLVPPGPNDPKEIVLQKETKGTESRTNPGSCCFAFVSSVASCENKPGSIRAE